MVLALGFGGLPQNVALAPASAFFCFQSSLRFLSVSFIDIIITEPMDRQPAPASGRVAFQAPATKVFGILQPRFHVRTNRCTLT
jgi:hypothetical protein